VPVKDNSIKMGLDSFKTDGPRTYTKGGTATTNVATTCIHLAKGMDDTGHGFLKRHETHIALKTNEAMNIKLPSGGPYFICSECGNIADSYEAMLKADLVDFIDKDWVDTAREELLGEFSGIDEEVYHDEGLEGVELEDDTDDSSQSSSSSSSPNSSSSKNEKDFDSGLGSFMS